MDKKILAVGTGITIALMCNGCGSKVETQTPVSEEIDSPVILGEYKGLTLGVELKEATQEEIDDISSQLVTQYGGHYEDAPDGAAVKSGDQIEFEYFFKDPESGTESESNMGTLVIGDEYWPAEFSTGMTGLREGEEVTVTLSEDQGSGEYRLIVNNIKTLAPLTDEYVKSLDLGVETVEEYNEEIKKYIEDQHREDYENELKEAAEKATIASSKVTEVSDELVAEYLKILNTRIDTIVNEKVAAGEEYTKEDLLGSSMLDDSFAGSTDDYVMWYAEKNAKEYMIYKEIADRENITVDDIDLYSYIAGEWKNQEGYETLKDFIAENGTEQYYRAILSENVKLYIAHEAADYIPMEDIASESTEAQTDENNEDTETE